MSAPRDPKPGHPDAVAAGCTCPVLDNHHGAGRGGPGSKYMERGWWMRDDCPLHGEGAK